MSSVMMIKKASHSEGETLDEIPTPQIIWKEYTWLLKEEF